MLDTHSEHAGPGATRLAVTTAAFERFIEPLLHALVLFLLFQTIVPLAESTAAEDSGAAFTSLAGFALLQGTLSDVQNRLGKAKLIESGDAGD
jgi:hypothetical protein